MRDRKGREGGGGHLSRSLAYDEAPEQCGPKATQQRRVAVLVCLERVPNHLRHLHARVSSGRHFATCSWALYAAAAVATVQLLRLKLLHTPHLLRR